MSRLYSLKKAIDCDNRTGSEGSFCQCGKNHTYSEEFVRDKAIIWLKKLNSMKIEDVSDLFDVQENSTLKPEHFTNCLKRFVGITDEDLK